MGDRCYMSIICRKEDAAKFTDDNDGRNLGFVDMGGYADLDAAGLTEVVDEGRNYGDTDDLPRDIPYIGNHNEGDEYGGRVFACDGERFAEADAAHGETCPIVEVGRTTGLSSAQLTAAREYWETYRRACEALGYQWDKEPDRIAVRKIELPIGQCVITLRDWDCITQRAGGGSIESSLHEAVEQEGDDEEQAQVAVYNLQMDAIESMILAHAIAGIDVASPAYVEGITTAVEACANNH